MPLSIGTVFVATSPVVARRIPEDLSEQEAARYTTLNDGQVIYSKPMWWVVGRTFDRHYVCLPITTYNGKGTTKRGIKPEHHGIAYDSRGKATLLPRETSLHAYAVVVDTGQRKMIDSASRIDFSKPTFFENYRRLSKIGMIDHSDLQAFEDHYRHVQTTSATHGYENTYTSPLILSTSYSRAVTDSWLPDMDIDGVVQLLAKKKHEYIWQCYACRPPSITYWAVCSIIVCWEISQWELDIRYIKELR